VDQGHRPDSALALLKQVVQATVIDCRGLQTQEARNDLHVVLDPMVDLPQQHLLLIERPLDGFLCILSCRHVLDHSDKMSWAAIVVASK